MFARLYSFKFIISIALLWLGALAYGLAIFSTHVYRDHAIGNQMESLQSLLELQSRDEIKRLYDTQKRFAYKLQNEEPFRQALRDRDEQKMVAWLGESYSRYLNLSADFKLKSIVVRDLSGEIFAQSLG